MILCLFFITSCGNVSINIKDLEINNVIPINIKSDISKDMVATVTDINSNTGSFTLKSESGEIIEGKTSTNDLANLKKGSKVRITKRVKNSTVNIPSKGVNEIILEDVTDSNIDYR